LGRLGWWLNIREAVVARKNLAICFPDKPASELQALAKRSVIEAAKTAAEMPAIWLRPYERLRAKVITTRDEDLLDAAMSTDKGLIVMTPHLGSWEVAGLYVSERITMTSLYQPAKFEALDALVKKARSRLGAKMAPTDRRGVKALLSALRRGEVVGILPDQEPDLSGGVFAPFFGVSTLTMTLVLKMIARTGCRALMCYAKRVKGGFELIFIEPEAALFSDDEVEAATALNLTIEKCILDCPEQYQWGYKRFKKRPAGENKIY
jgi:KDO2-lipid IV(A) lauroyltransferase